MKIIKNAFTVVELIIAILISAIILVFLMSYLADTFNEIAYSNKKTKVLINLYEIENKLKSLKWSYLSGEILKDNSEWVWSDIILLKTIPWEPKPWWYIFAQVDKNTLKVDPNNNVDIIWEKVLAHRKISWNELAELLVNWNKIYEYQFNLDETFPDILLKDFQAKTYNSWSIFEVSLYVNLDYIPESNGNKFSNIWNNEIEKIIFNF